MEFNRLRYAAILHCRNATWVYSSILHCNTLLFVHSAYSMPHGRSVAVGRGRSRSVAVGRGRSRSVAVGRGRSRSVAVGRGRSRSVVLWSHTVCTSLHYRARILVSAKLRFFTTPMLGVRRVTIFVSPPICENSQLSAYENLGHGALPWESLKGSMQ